MKPIYTSKDSASFAMTADDVIVLTGDEALRTGEAYACRLTLEGRDKAFCRDLMVKLDEVNATMSEDFHYSFTVARTSKDRVVFELFKGDAKRIGYCPETGSKRWDCFDRKLFTLVAPTLNDLQMNAASSFFTPHLDIATSTPVDRNFAPW